MCFRLNETLICFGAGGRLSILLQFSIFLKTKDFGDGKKQGLV